MTHPAYLPAPSDEAIAHSQHGSELASFYMREDSSSDTRTKIEARVQDLSQVDQYIFYADCLNPASSPYGLLSQQKRAEFGDKACELFLIVRQHPNRGKHAPLYPRAHNVFGHVRPANPLRERFFKALKRHYATHFDVADANKCYHTMAIGVSRHTPADPMLTKVLSACLGNLKGSDSLGAPQVASWAYIILVSLEAHRFALGAKQITPAEKTLGTRTAKTLAAAALQLDAPSAQDRISLADIRRFHKSAINELVDIRGTEAIVPQLTGHLFDVISSAKSPRTRKEYLGDFFCYLDRPRFSHLHGFLPEVQSGIVSATVLSSRSKDLAATAERARQRFPLPDEQAVA